MSCDDELRLVLNELMNGGEGRELTVWRQSSLRFVEKM